jgi:thioredoxin-related protein
MVQQLEAGYGKQVHFTRYLMDALDPSQRDEMRQVAQAVDFKVTPTFVFVDRTGRITAKYEGVTSYWTLRRALDDTARP